MNLRQATSLVSGYCFTLSMLVYVIVNEYIAPNLLPGSTLAQVLLSIASSIGAYSIIFNGLFYLYTNYLFRKLDRRKDIQGTWYHVTIINGDGTIYDRVRHGECSISSSIGEISISTLNHRLDANNTYSSNWNTDTSTLVGREISLIFSSSGVHRQRVSTGVMRFHISGNPPTKLIGHWTDSWPGTNSGSITIFKNEDDYNKEMGTLRDLINVEDQ